MKKLFKRSAIALVLVFAMIAAVGIAVSASTTVPADTVASATVNGQTKYYSDFAQLVYEANGSGIRDNRWTNFEITLYDDVEMNTALVAVDSITVKAAEGLADTPTLTAKITNNYHGTLYRGAFVFASASNKVAFKDINIVVEESTLTTDKGAASLVMMNGTTTDVANGKKHYVDFDNVNVTAVGAVINQYGTGELTNCYVTVNGGSIVASGDFIEGARSTKSADFAFNLAVTGGATFNVANIYSAPTAGGSYITYANAAYLTTAEGVISFYDTAEAAIIPARTAKAKITLLKSAKITGSYSLLNAHAVTITALDKSYTLELGAKAFLMEGGRVAFENMNLYVTGDSFYIVRSNPSVLSFTDVEMSASNYVVEYASDVTTPQMTIYMTNCNVNHRAPTPSDGNAYVFLFTKSTSVVTYHLSNVNTNVPLQKGTGSSASFVFAGTVKFNGDPITSVDQLFHKDYAKPANLSQTYGNDAIAKQFGYTHRVGTTEGGKVGEVYFATAQAAIDYATANETIAREISTGTVVYCKHVPTDAGVVNPAPTCTTEGTVTHTCALCGETYTETVGVLDHADAANDGDHKCDTCPYVFADACADAANDGDHKCDECNADNVTACADVNTDDDHKCDECQAVLGTCADAAGDGDHACDECGAANITACAGGTATCMAKAVCEECNEAYGEKAPANHTGNNTVRDAASPSCVPGYTGDTYCECGAKVGDGEEIPATGTHNDVANDGDHKCDGCNYVFENACADAAADGDHACDECGAANITTCADVNTDDDHKCDDCQAVLGTCSDVNTDDDHNCDECGAVLGTCADAAGDNNHACDECGAANVTTCADATGDGNHACDECGAANVTACAGGTATCMAKAVCSECNTAYGEKAPTNHTGNTTVKDAVAATCAEAGYTGDTYCECGAKVADGTAIAATGAHVDSDEDYKCDECGADYGEAPATTTAATTTAAATTAAATTAAATTAAATTAADKIEEPKGCGGTVTVAGLALVAALGSCAIFVEKKRR